MFAAFFHKQNLFKVQYHLFLTDFKIIRKLYLKVTKMSVQMLEALW